MCSCPAVLRLEAVDRRLKGARMERFRAPQRRRTLRPSWPSLGGLRTAGLTPLRYGRRGVSSGLVCLFFGSCLSTLDTRLLSPLPWPALRGAIRAPGRIKTAAIQAAVPAAFGSFFLLEPTPCCRFGAFSPARRYRGSPAPATAVACRASLRGRIPRYRGHCAVFDPLVSPLRPREHEKRLPTPFLRCSKCLRRASDFVYVCTRRKSLGYFRPHALVRSGPENPELRMFLRKLPNIHS